MAIYLFDGPVLNTHRITKQVRTKPVSLGRGLDCDVILGVRKDGSRIEQEDSDLAKSLASVSREHATLTYDEKTKTLTLNTSLSNQSFCFDPFVNAVLPIPNSFDMDKRTHILYLGSGQYGPVIILQE